MSGRRPEPPCVDGFTLIEVVGAVLLFSVALLMVIQLSGSMATQIERAAVSSEIVSLARARLDSLERLDFDSLTVGTAADTLTVRGFPYRRSSTISTYGPLLLEISVSLTPVTAGDGPSYSTESYKAGEWDEG